MTPLQPSTITVLQIRKSETEAIAGLPWKEAIAGRDGDLRTGIKYGIRYEEQPSGSVFPKGATVYCPLDHAWLREIDGKARLYIQNW